MGGQADGAYICVRFLAWLEMACVREMLGLLLDGTGF